MKTRVGPLLASFVCTRALHIGGGLGLGHNVLSAGRGRPLSLLAGTESPIAVTKVAIESSSVAASEWSGDLLVLPFWEAANSSELVLSPDFKALDDKLDGVVSDLVSDEEFKGAAGSKAVATLTRSAASRRIALVGMGKEDKWAATGARTFGTTLATVAKDHKAKAMGAVVAAGLANQSTQAAVVEAVMVSLSPDKRYKSDPDSDDNKPPPLQTIELLGDVADGAIERGRTIAAGLLVTRGRAHTGSEPAPPSTSMP